MKTNERDFMNHHSHFGVVNCVERVGRKWRILYDVHPALFPTKRAAMDAANRLVLAIYARHYITHA